MLFAISYTQIPELIAVRERYERIWAIAIFIVVIGCLVSIICFRRWTKRRVLEFRPRRHVVGAWLAIGGVAAAGVALGVLSWVCGLWYTWGTEQRSVAEVTTCFVGGAAWGSVLGQLLCLALYRPTTVGRTAG